MKVRCIKLTNAFGEPVLDTKGNPAQSDGWLTVGKDYHVLEVLLDSGEWKLRIMNDEGHTPALFPLANFEIVSPRISPTWIVRWGENGYFELTPEAWAAHEFWDRYFDQDSWARRVFEDERNKIITADP